MALGIFSSPTQRKPYQRGMGMQPPAGQPQQPSIFGQTKPLQAPQPLTQGGAMAQQQNVKSLQTGQFGDVQSAQAATGRANALRQYQAIQMSRANAVRGNLSAEQAQRGQDQSLAAANAQNLTAQNSVNALQRQYGQDALNRADTYENDAYGKATTERGYQDSRDDLGYSRATDEKRYGDSRGDVAFGQNMQTQQFGANRQDAAFSQGLAKDQFGASRQDAAFSQGLAKDQFAANRDDTMYSRGYQQSRDQVGDARYDQSYQDSRGDVQYARGRDAVGDQRYNQEYTDKRGDVQYARGIDESRYGDTRADVKYGQEYQASRDQVGDQRYDQNFNYQAGRDQIGDQRYDQSYADQRGDVAYNRTTDASRYQDTRADVQYGQQYQASRDAVGDARYGQEYADTRGDVQYQRGYQENRDATADQRYDATTQYQQSRDALGDQRYDQSYQDQRADTTYNRTEAQRLEGKGDISTLISSVQDPRAQNLLRNVQAQGGDVQAMYNTMLDNGTIKEEYRSAAPGTVAAQAKIDELKSFYPNKTDAEIQQMALSEREQERAAIQKPLADATNKAAGEEVLNILANGGTPSEPQIKAAITSGAIPTISAAGLPIGTANETKFSQENGGKMVNIGGTVYKVEPQNSTMGNTQVSTPIFINSKTGERMMVDGGALKVIPKTSMYYKA